MSRLRVLLFASVLLGSAGCDHAAKWIARDALAPGAMVSLAAGAVRLELVSNPGAFLSVGMGLAPELRHLVFLVAVPLLLVGLCVLALRSGRAPLAQLVGLACVAGGGFANWLDRLLHGGAVTDFVSLGIGPLRTGIFNLADVVILLGIGLFLLAQRGGGRAAGAAA